MASMADFFYRFDGDAIALAKARELIERLQYEYAEICAECEDGFSSEPEIESDGAMYWNCQTFEKMDDFDDEIVALTGMADLRCYNYWESEDGYSASALNLFEKGLVEGLCVWDLNIGIRAAVAIFKLSKSADARELLVLIHSFLCALEAGGGAEDDDEDYPWLFVAESIANQIMLAVASHSGLLGDKSARNALSKMKKPLERARMDMNQLLGLDASRLGKIDQLRATIEGLEINGFLPKARLSKRRALSL